MPNTKPNTFIEAEARKCNCIGNNIEMTAPLLRYTLRSNYFHDHVANYACHNESGGKDRHKSLVLLFRNNYITSLRIVCHNIVTIYGQYASQYCERSQYCDRMWRYCLHIVTILSVTSSTSTIQLTYMLSECGHNIVKYPPYCDHIRLTHMLTVLWNLTVWWAILS